ncbi:unnamed protein product [Lupinus luteus]|uniref:Hexosyltransferase n=1 Tax=Lupinus luteus TaxID=3873 RepID=A0AAV1WCY3_LUPLU
MPLHPKPSFSLKSSTISEASKINIPMMVNSLKPKNRGRSLFLFYCFIFIFFLCVLASINEVRFDTLLRFGKCAISSNTLATTSSISEEPELRILIAVLTLPDQYLRRHFLRLIYGSQKPEGAKVDVKFVFCNLTKEDQKVLVALEIMRYDDIIILNCTENMNKGKTSTFFSTLPEIFNETNDNNAPYPPYHYVMKADDDTFVRLNALVESLKPLPREDLYYGFVIPCGSMDPFKHYMSGMGFVVSWDIVEWIHGSDIPKKHVEGPEDKVFGDWMKWGRRVHLLKNQEKWIRTLNFFNFTRDLNPSKMYHIS